MLAAYCGLSSSSGEILAMGPRRLAKALALGANAIAIGEEIPIASYSQLWWYTVR